MKDKLNYQLCYIDNIDDWNTFKIYFTSKFEGQWGDDWNDRPANCNAGGPYDEDREIFSIIVEFNGYGQTTFGGKVYSVEDMNNKKACWLIHEDIFFEGGDTLKDILTKIATYNSTGEEYNNIAIYTEFTGDES